MISIGDRLDSKYRVTRRLGGGGFGEVFLANDEKIPGHQVAIKVLSRAEDGDHSDLMWEMQQLAKFNHPHVVTFHHHFSDESRLYLVMEFCSAGSLHDRMKSAGHFPEEQVFAWGQELCETLAFVHGKGIVHHDIKPLNILFAADGIIKLGDFGVANRNIGTRVYMPPEMFLGEPVSHLDQRVDVYALGITLLELLTGCNPFGRLKEVEQVLSQVSHDFIPTSLPRWVQDVLLKATHPTPELRFQTAEEFAEAIRDRDVAYVFDGNRIRSAAMAKKSEAALARKKWKAAEEAAFFAVKLSPGCVAALLAAGRCQVMIHRLDRAAEYFYKALSISPRTAVQKELGWISLERGRVPSAISLLTDHLQRNASDYEAYNLLLKCFYMTDRFEAAESLASTMIDEKAPNGCFRNNQILCRLLKGDVASEEMDALFSADPRNPFTHYNREVATEKPRAWGEGKQPSLKSKLLFEEYSFGSASRACKTNALAITTADDVRRDFKSPIVTIGSSSSNDVILTDSSVSRRHCAIVNYPDCVWLYDLESTVGTVVDKERLAGRMLLNGRYEVEVGRNAPSNCFQ